MDRTRCAIVAVLTAFALAMVGADAARPRVSLHLAAPGSDLAASPPFVVIRDLPIPAAGATVVINARARGLAGETRVATLFIVGTSRSSATIVRTVQSPLQTTPDIADALSHDPNATVTVLICRTHETSACTTVGPLALSVERA